MISAPESRILPAIMRLDAWLDSMWSPGGYGGPVAHWWNDSLLYTGAGIDWRYEGIVLGYLGLYQKTGATVWLHKAQRAANDIVNAQMPAANFYNSSFELNPHAGGMPHEAACDLALLELADFLKSESMSGWEGYAQAAEKNLVEYHLEKLWIEEMQGFGNSADNPTFTPNKTCTVIEAIFALAKIHGDTSMVDQFALPASKTVLRHQITDKHHHLHGAIDQSSLRNKGCGRFFPYYNARCIPALVLCYEYTHSGEYLDAAVSVANFILRYALEDGSFPQVLYARGDVNRYPRWIAACGDILYALNLVATMAGLDISSINTLEWLLRGQTPCGGISTARGFASQVSQKPPSSIPEFRDILCVCGWNDKAFRFLASLLPQKQYPSASLAPVSMPEMRSECLFRGKRMIYREDAHAIELWHEKRQIYHYSKGSCWAQIAE